MCVGDWRLGRLITTQLTAIATGGAVTVALNPNPYRVGLLIGQYIAALAITNQIQITASGSIIGMTNTYAPMRMFTLTEHGRLVQGSWSFTTIGAEGGTIVEFMLPEMYLQAGLDSFNSEYDLR